MSPDFYAAAAQLVPVLLLAIVFQFRYANPFAQRLMDADMRIQLLLEATLQESRRRAGSGQIVYDDAPTEEELDAQREAGAALRYRLRGSFMPGEYLQRARHADTSCRVEELEHYSRVKRHTWWWIMAPLGAGFVAMVVSFVALSFDKPSAWWSLLVWPGVAGLVGLFFASLGTLMTQTGWAADEAATDHLLAVGAIDEKQLFFLDDGPGFDEERFKEELRQQKREDEARARMLRRHLAQRG